MLCYTTCTFSVVGLQDSTQAIFAHIFSIFGLFFILTSNSDTFKLVDPALDFENFNLLQSSTDCDLKKKKRIDNRLIDTFTASFSNFPRTDVFMLITIVRPTLLQFNSIKRASSICFICFIIIYLSLPTVRVHANTRSTTIWCKCHSSKSQLESKPKSNPCFRNSNLTTTTASATTTDPCRYLLPLHLLALPTPKVSTTKRRE